MGNALIRRKCSVKQFLIEAIELYCKEERFVVAQKDIKEYVSLILNSPVKHWRGQYCLHLFKKLNLWAIVAKYVQHLNHLNLRIHENPNPNHHCNPKELCRIILRVEAFYGSFQHLVELPKQFSDRILRLEAFYGFFQHLVAFIQFWPELINCFFLCLSELFKDNNIEAASILCGDYVQQVIDACQIASSVRWPTHATTSKAIENILKLLSVAQLQEILTSQLQEPILRYSKIAFQREFFKFIITRIYEFDLSEFRTLKFPKICGAQIVEYQALRSQLDATLHAHHKRVDSLLTRFIRINDLGQVTCQYLWTKNQSEIIFDETTLCSEETFNSHTNELEWVTTYGLTSRHTFHSQCYHSASTRSVKNFEF